MRTEDALKIGMALGRISKTLDAWEESKHPRADNGQFSSGGGGGGKSRPASFESGGIKHTTTSAGSGKGVTGSWKNGTMEMGGKKYKFNVKEFETGSQYGIDGGSLSKVQCNGPDGKVLFRYDRGWEIKPKTKEAKKLLEHLKKTYNNNGEKYVEE